MCFYLSFAGENPLAQKGQISGAKAHSLRAVPKAIFYFSWRGPA